MSQELMVREIVEQYGLSNAKALSTPLSPSIKLIAEDGDLLDSSFCGLLIYSVIHSVMLWLNG
jgi:hypothetical protein